jgi:CheY-like chemotaxis protein
MGKTLLLADDSVTIQKVVGISFASEDISLVTVDNGDDAIARARALHPDVILADVVMPGKSGYEVCEAIKADPALRHIPVLLLTGTFEAFDNERASRAGAAGHIAKPFEAQALVERVKRLLASAPAPAPAPPAAPRPPMAAPQQPAAAPARPAPPAAKPAPAPTPTPAPAPSVRPAAARSEEAFDFFDDGGATETVPPTRTATAASQLDESASANLNFDGGDDNAFAFGDDDLGPTPPRTSAAAHTVAILPDAPVSESSDALALDTGVDAADAELELATPRPYVRAPAAVTPALEESERFDFEFAGGEERESGAMPNAAVLDPIAGSDYDVSSSDLRAMVSPAATRLLDPEPAAPLSRIGDDPVMDLLEGDLTEGEASLATDPAGDTYDRVAEAPRQTASAPPRVATPAPPARSVAPRPAPSRDETALSDAVVARVAPALREQLHDTLEKMAWEAFGSAAESIIEQAVERLEKVAWEVVPRLAETLILEEIRKLKGGDSDEPA